ncbi:MAG: tetratricopeptide repeat protein [Acidobacteriia bacterium]|nr:tetratricopeptide repeat protein [Terriglobia bacterium]
MSILLAFQVTDELRQRVDAGLKAKAVGDFETAVREFKRVAELAPKLAAAHVNLGAVYFEMKNYTQAIPALRKALDLNPDLPGAGKLFLRVLEDELTSTLAESAHFQLAQVYRKLGRSADADREMSRRILCSGRWRRPRDSLIIPAASRPSRLRRLAWGTSVQEAYRSFNIPLPEDSAP